MKPKTTIKIVIDVFMTIGLLFAFGYQFWGEKWHEWIGAGMFVLFILHHILNTGWHKNLFKGRYTPTRILTLVIDIALMGTFVFMAHYCAKFLRRIKPWKGKKKIEVPDGVDEES